jgi:hypothetical protein
MIDEDTEKNLIPLMVFLQYLRNFPEIQFLYLQNKNTN